MSTDIIQHVIRGPPQGPHEGPWSHAEDWTAFSAADAIDVRTKSERRVSETCLWELLTSPLNYMGTLLGGNPLAERSRFQSSDRGNGVLER